MKLLEDRTVNEMKVSRGKNKTKLCANRTSAVTCSDSTGKRLSLVTPSFPLQGWEDGRQGPLRGAVAEGEPPSRQLLGAELWPGKAISVSFFY